VSASDSPVILVAQRVLRFAPGLRFLAECVYRSPGSWLFRGENLAWLRDDALVSQLPFAYRLFARYCRAFGRNPPGAELFLRTIIRRQRHRNETAVLPLKIHGLTVCLDLCDPRFLAVPNEIAKGLPRLLSRFLRPGDTFLDIGANHGTFAVTASQIVGPAGRVIAIEPQEPLARLVRQSLASGDAPFAVHNVACGHQPGTAELYVPEASSGAAGLHKSYSASTLHRAATVNVVRLDDLLAPETLPGNVFVKIDIEGNESNCLRGASQFLAAHRPPILIELNPRALQAAGTSVRELLAILREHGYSRCLSGRELNVESPLTPDIADGNILALHQEANAKRFLP
jgi:FkbM family methyltransferase